MRHETLDAKDLDARHKAIDVSFASCLTLASPGLMSSVSRTNSDEEAIIQCKRL